MLEARLDRRAAHGKHPKKPVYTFWSVYLRKSWERDAGMRIDHLLLSPSLAGRMVKAGVDSAVRGLEGASDHAPAWVEVRPDVILAGSA